MTHPNEIPLVRRTESGNLIPAREHAALKAEAEMRGGAWVAAFNLQIARQEALTA